MTETVAVGEPCGRCGFGSTPHALSGCVERLLVENARLERVALDQQEWLKRLEAHNTGLGKTNVALNRRCGELERVNARLARLREQGEAT